MALKLQHSAQITIICAILLLFSSEQIKAQSIKTYTESSPQQNTQNSRNGFQKIEEFFFKEFYAQCLAEIKNLDRATLNDYQSSIIDFYESVSTVHMQEAEAEWIVKEFISTNKNTIYNNIAMAILAQELLEVGAFEEAEEAFKKVEINSLSNNMANRYNFYYGKYLFDTGQFLEAKYRLIQINLENNQYSNDIIYYLSYINYFEKKYDTALDGFMQLSMYSKFDKAKIYIAQIKFQNGDYQYIIDNIQPLLKLEKDENQMELYRIFGESFFALNNNDEAINYLNKFTEAGGVLSAEHLYIIGYSHYMNNMYPQAIEHLTQIIEGEDQMTQNAYYHLADSYLRTNNQMGALRAFSMAAILDHDKRIGEDALYNQVKLTYETGGGNVYSRLLELMQRFMKKYPDSKHSDEIKGYLLAAYINTSDYANAKKYINIVKNPSNEIMAALQRMCYEQAINSYSHKNYERAITLFDEALAYRASAKYNALSLYWKAEAMYKTGDTSERTINYYKDFLSQSTSVVKENIFARYSLGYIYFNNKQWDEAETWFKNFVSLYKNQDTYLADVMNRLGDIHFKKLDLKKAIEYYDLAKTYNPLDTDYSDYQIAESWGLSKNPIKKSEKLKEIASSENSIYKDLALVELASTYNKSGKYKESENTLIDFVVNNPHSPYYTYALMELAIACANQNKNQEALKHYKQIITSNTNSIEANEALIAIKSLYVSEGDITPYFEFMKSVNMDSDIDSGQKEKLSYQALQNQYMINKHEAVINLALKYRKEFPNGSHKNDVTYYYAESLMKTGKEGNALEEFEKIITLPNNPYTVSSLLLADRIYSKINDLKNRYICNEKIYLLSNDEKIKQDALENIMSISIKMKDDKLITDSYTQIFKHKNPSKEALGLARFARAKIAFNKKDYITAFADLRKTGFPLTREEGAEGEYMKAVILFDEKKYNDTEEFVLAFAKRGTPHQYWVAKSFILLGDVYVARDDLFQAKATYQSIVEGYDNTEDGIIELTKGKIEELGSLDNQ